MSPFKNEQLPFWNWSEIYYSSAFEKEGDNGWVTVDKIQEHFVKRLLSLDKIANTKEYSQILAQWGQDILKGESTKRNPVRNMSTNVMQPLKTL